jgi:hypothetical protein
MAVFSPAFRDSKLSELLEQCVRIPNSSASIRFLAVLIEDAGEALMREDLLWRGRRGGLKTARAAYAGGVVFVDRRPGIFIRTEVTVTSLFFQTTIEKLASLPEQGVLCAGRRSIRF